MQPGARPGKYVSISVADTGIGIAPDHLDRIFDPFFTTKVHGEGTGLGLSMALGIVQAHGGFINVASNLGQGSRFTVHLPAVVAGAALGPHEAKSDRSPTLPEGNGELVMIVDDEADIREVTGRVLAAFGYRVQTAKDGDDAVRLFERHRGEFAAVVLDMMMPFMDGLVTARALRRLDPNVRLIGSSGLMDAQRRSEAEAVGFTAVLRKPYTADELLKVLGRSLAAGR
jgi:CheY-like chemotaxis protein